MLIPKVIAVLMALLYSSGFSWFPGDSVSTVDILVIIIVFSAFVVALSPENKIQNHFVAYSLLGLVVAGIFSLITIMVIDFIRPHGSDVVGRSLDFIFIVSFAYMGKNIYKTLNASEE